MKTKFVFLVLFFLILGTLFVSAQSRQYAPSGTYSNVQFQSSPYASYSSSQNSQYWPRLNANEDYACKERQDIIVKVAPFGCQPMVVRSDLLAEQNVPVFCQLEGLNVNPFIEIERLGRPVITGNFPPELVSSVGYYPSTVRLGAVNSIYDIPDTTNLGYVVVVLRQQPNEEKIPEKIEFDLTVRFPYTSSGSFGTRVDGDFLLQVVNDSEWENTKINSVFLNNYFLRLDRADQDSATVRVYNNQRVLGTATSRIDQVSSGLGNSNFISIPETTCNAGIKVEYKGFVSGRNTAILDVDGTSVEVYEGFRFLDDKCTVRKLIIGEDKATGTVEISCYGSGTKTLSLEKNTGNVSSQDGVPTGDVKKYYESANAEYNNVISTYGALSREGDLESKSYEEVALLERIELANSLGQTQVVQSLTQTLVEKYPGKHDLTKIEAEAGFCEIYNCDKNVAYVTIGDYASAITLLRMKEPVKKASADFVIGSDRKTIYIGDKNDLETGSFTLINVRDNEVEISYVCSSGQNSPATKTLRVSSSTANEDICGTPVRLTAVDKSDFALIGISSSGAQTESVSNFSVSIGLEKRAIKLNPEKTQEKIDNLDDSIEKWKDISDNLGTLTDGFQAACFATSAALTVKNFFTGLGGESLARDKVMNEKGGWVDRCKELVADGTYPTINVCFNDNSDDIGSDIQARLEVLQGVDSRIKEVQSRAGITEEDFVESSVNVQAAKVEYLKLLRETYGDDELLNGINEDNLDRVSYLQLRDLDEALALKNSENIASEKAGEELYTSLNNRIKPLLAYEKLEGTKYASVGYNARDLKVIKVQPLKVNEDTLENNQKINGAKVDGTKNVVFVGGSEKEDSDFKQYMVVGNTGSDGKSFVAEKIYRVTSETEEEVIVGDELAGTDFQTFNSRLSISRFETINGVYDNPISKVDRNVQFFENGAYSGLPALVPFDVQGGFYVKIDSSLGVGGNIAGYDSAGRPKSFSICNVDSDLRIDDSDTCRSYQIGINEDVTFPGMDASNSRALLSQALTAIEDAKRQKDRGSIIINGEVMNKKAAYHGPEKTCQEFMSPEECTLLFNVCDPVVCPSSRCNLGGEYQVADVVQTGIIGSALLCLPNIQEGVVVPVCLSGIKAGVDGYLSILQAHRACLAESLSTGSQTGICDAITSVYTCEFFWRQAGPIADSIVPKLFDSLSGKGARGGGEYLFAQEAWQNTKESVDYLNNYYGGDALRAFNIKSVAEAGTQFCRSFISVKAPTSIEGVLEPRSPPQFHAVFSEIPYSDATIPATSQYKVFYHIFSGNERGTAFTVYLKDPPESVTYSVQPRVVVASNYIAAGGYASETVDFTAPAGYGQLCVAINDGFTVQEECGFGQVSTSFAADYLSGQFTADQAKENNIKTQAECISGSPSLISAFSASPQEVGQELITPQVYDRGIVRICSSENPGKSTTPERYKDVGYCGDENLRCWLDKNSVKEAMGDENVGIKNRTLSEIENNIDVELKASVSPSDIQNIRSQVDGLNNVLPQDIETKASEVIGKIDILLNGNGEKVVVKDADFAELVFQKARVYSIWAKRLNQKIKQEEIKTIEEPVVNKGTVVQVPAEDSNPQTISVKEVVTIQYGGVADRKRIFLNGEDIYLYVHGSRIYSRPENGGIDSNGRVIVSSSDRNVGSVDSDGKISILSGIISGRLYGLLNGAYIPEMDYDNKVYFISKVENYQPEEITKNFDWTYNGKAYSISLNFYPEVYDYFRSKERYYEFAEYVSDVDNKRFISSLTNEINDYGLEQELTEEQIPYFINTFVQSITYVCDTENNNQENYISFPYETLYGNGGDCEDTAILLASMLRELHYGVIFIYFPGEHLAVGVKCNPIENQFYYTYKEEKYCYIESTGNGWRVGQIPENLQNKAVELYPLP